MVHLYVTNTAVMPISTCIYDIHSCSYSWTVS